MTIGPTERLAEKCCISRFCEMPRQNVLKGALGPWSEN